MVTSGNSYHKPDIQLMKTWRRGRAVPQNYLKLIQDWRLQAAYILWRMPQAWKTCLVMCSYCRLKPLSQGYCVRFLEAAPQRKKLWNWSAELLESITPVKGNILENMLHGFMFTATLYHSNGETVKAFVANLLRDYLSCKIVRVVLENAFTTVWEQWKIQWRSTSVPIWEVTMMKLKLCSRWTLI